MKNAKIVGAVIGSCISFLISGICAGAVYRNYEINFTHYPQEKLCGAGRQVPRQAVAMHALHPPKRSPTL